ncbi:MAG: hypothetical protein Q9168_006364 [Polycauliona sp. 1 TL-2023]
MHQVIPAIVMAAIHGAVSVTAQACASGTAQQIGGNWYCSAVKAITYSNFPGTGSYDKITNMDANTGQCTSEKQPYRGSLAPMSDELSMHFRGPTVLKQLAVYYPASDAKSKRSDHINAHARRHGQHHAHHHKRNHALAGRAVGDMVVATIDGQVVSWANNYAGPGAGPNTAAAQPAPEAQTTLATSFGTSSQVPSTTATPASSGSINPLPLPESSGDSSGQWARQAYYNADTGSSDGLTFLNHFGGTNGMPGTADGGPAFGASLSYASSDGRSAAASAQTLGNKMIDDDVEIIVLSDNKCEGNSCGYTRPGGVAYHGFGGDSKLFMLEFSMPMTGKTGFNADMPAIWLLNAQVPLTSQYGTNPKCSCWTSGCGEFDLFEILDTGNFRCKSTLHMAPAGGSSDYFQRPEKSTIKAAVLFSGADQAAHIKILDDSQNFDESLAADVVKAMAQDSDQGGQSSVFSPQTTVLSTPSSSSSSSQPPALPAKPSSLSSVVNNTASNYSPYGANRMGSSPYGVGGGYGSYSSPYSRMGGMNSMYGGYGGGYGGMYGGMGGGMGGMYGGGMGQPGMNPNDPNSLTNSFNQNTQATFQMIESIVGAFGGFAQMLESTYMATHSSFFAMISVAEQFSNLRTTLGSVLGIYTLLRWARTLLAKITGRPPPADATSLTPSAFAAFQGLSSSSSHQNPNVPPTPSKKPFLVFILAVFGLPYLMSKLIRSLAASQQSQQLALQPPNDNINNNNNKPIDPSQLLFCRVLYDYTPPNPSAAEGIDLQVKKGDLVAVLSQEDPAGNASEWWRCRSRDGKVGRRLRKWAMNKRREEGG